MTNEGTSEEEEGSIVNNTTFVYTGQAKQEISRDDVEVLIVDPSVRILPNSTFQDCPYLYSVKIPSSLRVIGKRAFEKCVSLEYVYIPDNVQVIGRQAFRDNSSLVHLRLPITLNSNIRTGICDGCDSLTSITIPQTVTKIGKHAFRDCTSLANVKFQNGLQVIGVGAFWKCESLRDLRLPETLETIQDEAFVWCQFPSISIPASCKTIGTKAFSGCAHLTTVTFQEGIQSLGRYSFCSCDLLVDISLPFGLTTIENRAFLMCISLQTISIPSTVSRIGDGAFASCSALTNVDLHQGLKSIGQEAFIRCRQLGGIALPSSLESVGSNAFYNCVSLQCIEIPSECQLTVGKKCFAGCKSLINISIPDSTRFITDDAFARCELLQRYDAMWSIRERFDGFPIHDICYHSSSKSLQDLAQALESLDRSDKGLKDPLGMTPLHILATAPNPRVDVLECLLDYYPGDILGYHDVQCKSMMYYVMGQTSNKVIPLIKVVLQRAIVERISKWGVPEKWTFDLTQSLDSIQGHDSLERNNSVYSWLNHARYYARLEMTSFLELALWKMRMEARVVAESENAESYRETCRCQSGADVVVENVLNFLWNGKPGSYVAMAIFSPQDRISEWAPWF